MKRSPLARGTSVLKRSPLARQARIEGRKAALRQRSDKAIAQDRVRAKLKAVHVQRVGGACEAGPVIRLVDGAHRCGGPLDLHEVKTRGRGGSAVDPANQLIVCRSSHDWIGQFPAKALELGLIRSSWDA